MHKKSPLHFRPEVALLIRSPYLVGDKGILCYGDQRGRGFGRFALLLCCFVAVFIIDQQNSITTYKAKKLQSLAFTGGSCDKANDMVNLNRQT